MTKNRSGQRACARAGRDNDRRQNDAKHASDHARAGRAGIGPHHEEMKFLEGLERQSLPRKSVDLRRDDCAQHPEERRHFL